MNACLGHATHVFLLPFCSESLYNECVPLFESLFQALNDADVRYVVVGGLATVLHGHARLTVDIDLMVDLSPEQSLRVIETLVGLGFQPQAPVKPQDFASREIRTRWIEEKGMQVFSMVDRANPIRVVDLFVEHPIGFEDLWSRAVKIQLGMTSVHVAAIDDLIRLKRLSNRPQDRTDIEKLQEIQRIRKEYQDE